MLPAPSADKLLQWHLEFSPARKPGAVDSIAGAVNIAAPDALEAKQNIALQLCPDLLQLISEPDYGCRPQPLYRSKSPLIIRPFIRGHELDLMARSYDSICKSLQV